MSNPQRYSVRAKETEASCWAWHTITPTGNAVDYCNRRFYDWCMLSAVNAQPTIPSKAQDPRLPPGH